VGAAALVDPSIYPKFQIGVLTSHRSCATTCISRHESFYAYSKGIACRGAIARLSNIQLFSPDEAEHFRVATFSVTKASFIGGDEIVPTGVAFYRPDCLDGHMFRTALKRGSTRRAWSYH